MSVNVSGPEEMDIPINGRPGVWIQELDRGSFDQSGSEIRPYRSMAIDQQRGKLS